MSEFGDDIRHMINIAVVEATKVKDEHIAKLEAQVKEVEDLLTTLEANQIRDDDIESLIEYYDQDTEQYTHWGKVGRAKGYKDEADRLRRILEARTNNLTT